MSQTQETIPLNKLQQQDAAEVLAWLKRIESGQELPEAGFNWLGLAELAAFEAHSKYNLLWAEVATSVYDRLAAENNSVRESLMISSMLVRAAAIAQHGQVSGHPVLDLQQIVRWFGDGLTISPHRAASKARHWRSCNIEEIRELRSIKNRLAAIAVLADSDKCVLPPEIKAWLSLREKLP